MVRSEATLVHKPDNPYPGPRPFELNDESRFFGRIGETSELAYLIEAHPAVLLYAQSGAGKTSLLNAGLLPRLRSRKLEVLPPARVGSPCPPGTDPDSLANIFAFSAIASWLGQEKKEDSGVVTRPPEWMPAATLAEGLRHFPRGLDEANEPVTRVLIFDQFEEIFYTSSERWPQRHAFFEQVAALLKSDSDLRVLFAIREEYLASFDAEAALLPEAGRVRFRLERLGRAAALDAVEKPIEPTRLKYDHGVAGDLVSDLLKVQVEDAQGKSVTVTGEFVEPVQLQLVCQNLFDRIPAANKLITNNDLKSFGNPDEALQSFYEQVLTITASKARVGEGKLRRWFQHQLITPALTRGTVFRGAETTGKLPNKAVEILEQNHLVRAEYRSGSRWYELTHDRFIRPILNSNLAWEAKKSARLGWLVPSLAIAIVFGGLVGVYDYQKKQAAINALEQEKNNLTTNVTTQAEVLQKNQVTIDFFYAVSSLRSNDTEMARMGLERSWKLDPVATLEAIDQYVASPSADSAISVHLSRFRHDLLKNAGDRLSTDNGLKQYVCAHNTFVVAMADRPEAVNHRLELTRKTFPNAELGHPSGGFVPIIIDSFLTCDDAAKRVQEANKRWNKGAYVNDWYTGYGCSSCTNLPGGRTAHP